MHWKEKKDMTKKKNEENVKCIFNVAEEKMLTNENGEKEENLFNVSSNTI
jgi:hypothetical protein